jgi:hypothetical protein
MLERRRLNPMVMAANRPPSIADGIFFVLVGGILLYAAIFGPPPGWRLTSGKGSANKREVHGVRERTLVGCVAGALVAVGVITIMRSL